MMEYIFNIQKIKTTLNEIFNPIYPKGVKSKTIYKYGVQGSKIPIKQYEFNTKKGNNVKVHIKITDDGNTANVMFYVNDTLDDKSSKNNISTRDEEILPSILGIIKKQIDRLNINEVEFKAYSSTGDDKYIKNLDMEKPKKELYKIINEFKNMIENYEPKEIPNSLERINMLKKFNKPITNLKDFDKQYYLEKINEIEKLLKNDDPKIYMLYKEIKNTNKSLIKNNMLLEKFEDFLITFKKYINAFISNKSENGLLISKNRRKDLYLKLINKYFKDKWFVDESHGFFTLTRR